MQYAIESQIRLRGLDVTDSMLIVKPRQVMTSLPLSMTSRRQEVLCEHVDWLFQGEDTIRTEDMVSVIEREGDAIALVMLSGVQYYTGQLFDMEAITRAGHAKVKRSRTLHANEMWNYTVVNIWSGSKPFIKVNLKPKCVLVLGLTFLIHFKCWLLYLLLSR